LPPNGTYKNKFGGVNLWRAGAMSLAQVLLDVRLTHFLFNNCPRLEDQNQKKRTFLPSYGEPTQKTKVKRNAPLGGKYDLKVYRT
jgi:hypothetical protein